MLLHGNLRECSISDLLAILARKGETGRLDVNLQSSTAQLYLVDGKPVDCCVGFLNGEGALELLLASNEGGFRFESGIAPPNLTFRNKMSSGAAELISTAASQPLPPPDESPTTPTNGRFKSIAIVLGLATIAGAVGLTIGSVIAKIQHRPNAELKELKSTSQPSTSSDEPKSVTKQINQQASVPPSSVLRKKAPEITVKPETADNLKADKDSTKGLSIAVVLRIEDGRVVEAYAAQPQSGREAYEATAVRLARQRRFNVKSGIETVYLTITEQ